MKSFWLSNKPYLIVRITLGVIFIVSGAIKIADPAAFSKTINAFAIIPEHLSYPAAIVISLSELILGTGLLADLRGSLGGILGLLLVFVLILSWALYMGYDIDCGCFGPEDPEAKAFATLKTSLARDVAMILSVIYLYFWRLRNNYKPRLSKEY